VVGVFGYSDEDGTTAADLPNHHGDDVVAHRVERMTRLVEELTSQRAAQRVGECVAVLVEGTVDGEVEGRAAHQGPDVDGLCLVRPAVGRLLPSMTIGDVVPAVVVDSEGVDLVVEPR